MLSARVALAPGRGAHLFDPASPAVRRLRGQTDEHLLLIVRNRPVRLDIVDGLGANGPVQLRFALADDAALELKIDTLRVYRGMGPARRFDRLARQLLALEAVDMRAQGSSLRAIADLLVGPGDWPGDGEYRKSRARRLIALGRAIAGAGPRPILADVPVSASPLAGRGAAPGVV